MNHEWKNKDKKYIVELQKLMDMLDNIEDEDLKYRLVIQFLKCDEILTLKAEKMFDEYYENGKKDNNKE